MTEPVHGDVWLVTFGAGRSGEPTKHRPGVVVAADGVTAPGPHGMTVVVPVSATMSASVLRPAVPSGEGVDRISVANCVGVRGVNRSRLLRRLGAVEAATLAGIEDALAEILSLDGT